MSEQLQALDIAVGEARLSGQLRLNPFSTENVAAYLPRVVKDGAAVLSVGGSGDHIINSALLGAASIHVFDSNESSRYWFELKRAALIHLTREEFLAFVGVQGEIGPAALCYATYVALRGFLSSEGRTFFDDAFAMSKWNGAHLRSSTLFAPQEAQPWRFNLYLQSREAYALAQQRLSTVSVRWRTTAIVRLVRELRVERFDAILLSNIADDAAAIFQMPQGYWQFFAERIVQPLMAHLRENGKLCAAYLYDLNGPQVSQTYRSELDDPIVRRKVLFDLLLQYQEFSFSGAFPGTTDGVLVLTTIPGMGR